MSYSRESTPGAYSGYDDYFPSASPTPSPRHYADPAAYTQPRSATRAGHSRHKSTSYSQTPLPARPPTAHGYTAEGVSPRFTSNGVYATANVSESRSSRKYSFSTPRPKNHERRSSHSQHRVSDHRYGALDDDEWARVEGVSYVQPPTLSRSRRDSRSGGRTIFYTTYAGHGTDYHDYYEQVSSGLPPMSSMPTPVGAYPQPSQTPQPSRRSSQARKPSISVPQRSQTAVPSRRPSSSHRKSKAAAPEPKLPEVRVATEEDARKHRIPEGYSLTHWDPSEHPILLLGSVFDANSLGKWIYDWTVYKFSKDHPMSEQAGDLWLLLIQLSGKVKRAEDVVPTVRQAEVREMVEDFIDSGDRLTGKLRLLLKRCEKPMLTSAKRGNAVLPVNAGLEFVATMWGRDRELLATEKFMASVRLWNLRFDANCETVLLNPGK